MGFILVSFIIHRRLEIEKGLTTIYGGINKYEPQHIGAKDGFCIFIASMSIIGPRPALWNQYDLIAERDKYGAKLFLSVFQ